MHYSRTAAISSVVPEHVRKLLTSGDGTTEGDLQAGTLAIQTVKTQLANHQTRRKAAYDRVLESRVPSLFDAAADKFAKYIDENDQKEDFIAIEGLPPNVLSRAAMKLENIPYDMLCKARQSSTGDEEVDEWVLRNEVWLRDASFTSERHQQTSSKRFRAGEHNEATQKTSKKHDWSHGLVGLSMHAEVVFIGSVLTDTSRTITRPTSLPGFKILDGRRSPKVCIQPSVKEFSRTFDSMTGGLLKGLEWDHVFVAGGIVLGALLCTDDKETTNTPEQWKSSDVDLYIHGLGPVEANQKIEHVFNVFKTNLPQDAPVLVVRNSKTITFFSKYPLRRIQVVLKLVDSPKDVLLNFDLDVCAIGWDGNEVWMLPRAARAIETGYTVFTMDLINGHYLGDRRATQEQRVFKYADKGYGIRILPSYLEGLRVIHDDTERLESLEIVEQEDNWILHDNWDLRDIQSIIDDARKFTDIAIVHLSDGDLRRPISHSELQERQQKTEDPPLRSVLSGLSLFMRHVALWERQVAGDIVIEENTWAAPMYDVYPQTFGISYNDAPDYTWDEGFNIDGFVSNLSAFNAQETDHLLENLDHVLNGYTIPRPRGHESTYLVENGLIQRITHAYSVRQILQPDCDVCLLLWLPEEFIKYAEGLISEAVSHSAVPGYSAKPFSRALKDDVSSTCVKVLDLQPVIWRITSITMWQQLSRTIDEVHEVLWSFHYANAGLTLNKEERLNLLKSQFSRRAIRMTTRDEFGAFARWVARKPAGFSNYNDAFSFTHEDNYLDE